MVETDKDGNFVLDMAEAGKLELMVAKEGFKPTIIQVTVKEGETVDLGDVVLKAPAIIKGKVKDVYGRPVAGAEVAISL